MNEVMVEVPTFIILMEGVTVVEQKFPVGLSTDTRAKSKAG